MSYAIRFLIVATLLALPAGAAEKGPLKVTKQTAVKTGMRDGVKLVADIFRPDADGKYPVLLERTPYNRKGADDQGITLASHGYIVVFQDTRGRYESGGEWYPFAHETNDGYDTIEWAAGLDGSNGRVGTFGGSYVGATQMLAAIGMPPHLVSIFPYVTASEYYDGWTYQSGALMQWFTESWTSGLARDTLNRKLLSQPKNWAFTLPVNEYPVLRAPSGPELAPYLSDWVAHETNDAYWKRWSISAHYPELNLKALHAGGWHDIFLKGTLKNYIGMSTESKLPEAQRLMIGPWAHAATSPEGRVGDVVFGKQAVLDMTQAILDWSDWALKGKSNVYATRPPVKIFVLGTNQWRYENEFPLKRQRLTRYYLHSATGAHGVHGDGSLTTEKPGNEPTDRFVYDPANPVPTIGGRLCCANDILPPGPHDQSPNESRDDVLVFSTPPLASDTEVTGFIKLELYASTTAADTDFTAMLVDVDPNGYSRLLTDGIVRAKFRHTTDRAEPITPGRIYRYEVDLWATSNVFKKGHRIRVDVSSSNFPRFNRNLNTGERIYGGAGMVKAKQTVYHHAEHPSALVLPVIPR